MGEWISRGSRPAAKLHHWQAWQHQPNRRRSPASPIQPPASLPRRWGRLAPAGERCCPPPAARCRCRRRCHGARSPTAYCPAGVADQSVCCSTDTKRCQCGCHAPLVHPPVVNLQPSPPVHPWPASAPSAPRSSGWCAWLRAPCGRRPAPAGPACSAAGPAEVRHQKDTDQLAMASGTMW